MAAASKRRLSDDRVVIDTVVVRRIHVGESVSRLFDV
jgi:hypothetical protein